MTDKASQETDQARPSAKSEQQTPAETIPKPVFIRRAKGMPFAEFKKACIEQFEKAGLLKSNSSKPLPDEVELVTHNQFEEGLTKLRDKLVLNPGSTTANKTESEKNTARGDGSSAGKAVVIKAVSSIIGMSEEYDYLERMCGKMDVDYTCEMQRQKSIKGRHYDIMSIKMKDGTERMFWFDITSFFGK